MIRFGESTRYYIFNCTKPAAILTNVPVPKAIETSVTWGFSEDAEDEISQLDQDTDDFEPSPDAYYLSDPKKYLKQWLENKGFYLEIVFEEFGKGKEKTFFASLECEIASGSLKSIGHGSKKKEAEDNACLTACKKLDQNGLLVGIGVSKPKRKNFEDDDAIDTYYDRTEQPKKMKEETSNVVETEQSLKVKKSEAQNQIQSLQKKISISALKSVSEDVDYLDAFMASLEKSE
ncbi:Kanadaptin, partial [Nowakowskiella sp. JEL0078]